MIALLLVLQLHVFFSTQVNAVAYCNYELLLQTLDKNKKNVPFPIVLDFYPADFFNKIRIVTSYAYIASTLLWVFCFIQDQKSHH